MAGGGLLDAIALGLGGAVATASLVAFLRRGRPRRRTSLLLSACAGTVAAVVTLSTWLWVSAHGMARRDPFTRSFEEFRWDRVLDFWFASAEGPVVLVTAAALAAACSWLIDSD